MSQYIPQSLAAYFVPPTDNLGVFAMLTGYSADYHFLNDALEKFTQNVKSQRAYEGGVSLALMLDENHPQISTVDCPGLAHLASKQIVKNAFKLLHAKVGLLLFKNKHTDLQTIRLVVSTGNWTRQTLEDSLDLVWSIDYEVRQENSVDEQAQTDFFKAYDFMKYALSFFDMSLLNSKKKNNQLTLTALRYQQFKNVLVAIEPVNNITPRFFDNRDESLLAQLPKLIKFHAGDSKRNYLCIGSGFYETNQSKNKIPHAISSIEKRLVDSDLLTKNSEKDIIVNPLNCQAVANNIGALQKNKWNVRSAFDTLYEGANNLRTLHAKFIFSARLGGVTCKHSWLYLGSGNITAPGFLNKASLHVGNLEAGILFSPEDLTWYDKEKPELYISNKLPINWGDETLITDHQSISAGSEMHEFDEQYLAAPVSYFTLYKTEQNECRLTPSENESDYQVLTTDNEVCHIENGKVIWPSAEPRQVLVSWMINDKEFTAYIPVFDEFGRLAATALPKLELDDAWMLLSAFPTLPIVDNEQDFEGLEAENANLIASDDDVANNSDYSLNKMMALIEYIAQQQTDIKLFDWPQWCHRLEQTFCQMESSYAIKYFQQIAINPLSPLWAKPFRPSFAENNHSDEGRLYEQVLTKIELTLKLTNLLNLGSKYE